MYVNFTLFDLTLVEVATTFYRHLRKCRLNFYKTRKIQGLCLENFSKNRQLIKLCKITRQLGKCWQHFKVLLRNVPATYKTFLKKSTCHVKKLSRQSFNLNSILIQTKSNFFNSDVLVKKQ